MSNITKESVIKELTEMAKLGMARTDHTVEYIREGKFDSEFELEAQHMRHSDFTDMLLELSNTVSESWLMRNPG